MSRWSGKCDFADSIEMHGGIEYLKNSKVYIYEEQPDGTYKDKLLHFEKESDVVPYYAHIIGMAYHNNAENKHVIHLSSKSYPDSHEEEMLGYHLKTLIRYYNYCKRKKIEFNVNDALKKFSEWTLQYDGDTIKTLAQRVKEKGKKASIEGLKLEFSERYREELRKELDRVLDKEEKESEKENKKFSLKSPDDSFIRGHRSKLYLFDDIDPELIASINACVKEFEVKKEKKDDIEGLYFLSSCEN